jgi:hypothetical protein
LANTASGRNEDDELRRRFSQDRCINDGGIAVFGIVTAFLSRNILIGVMVAAVMIALFFLLLRLTVYVIKGFVTKDNDSEK